MSQPYAVKICVLGESTVGKSSITLRFVQDTFTHDVNPTLGAAFLSKHVSTPQGTLYKLQIWDTAGQERYKALTPMYYRNASVVLVVYDITKRDTLTRGAVEWFRQLREHGLSQAMLLLIGNKVDLAGDNREVTKDEAYQYAKKIGAAFYETSAKTGENVSDIFTDICSRLEENESGEWLLQASPVGRTLETASSTKTRDKLSKKSKPSRRKSLVLVYRDEGNGSTTCCHT